jgi:DNA processing protein
VRGAVDAVECIRQGSAPKAVLTEITQQNIAIDADLNALATGTARLVTPEDDEWPPALTSIGPDSTPPFALWASGTGFLADLVRPAVAITGSRAASPYGMTVATDFGYRLAAAGIAVVNGGSFGIDDAALRGAMLGDRKPIVVQPCGIDQHHPRQQSVLFDAVAAEGGLIVSEHPIGSHPTRNRFHARARLLAMLSSATVIVEAGRRSGTLAVAQAAGRLGHRVYAVPGSIYSATSVGTNELLRSGLAHAACSMKDIELGGADG